MKQSLEGGENAIDLLWGFVECFKHDADRTKIFLPPMNVVNVVSIL
jgi:hypothetical protein